MTLLRTNNEDAVITQQRSADEFLAAEFEFPTLTVEKIRDLVVQDIKREYPTVADLWSPNRRDLNAIVIAIYAALGSPPAGSTVTVDSTMVNRVMQAAHQPGYELAKTHGLNEVTHGQERIPVNCQYHTQLEMTKDIIRAFGSIPK